jgi:hypothetical protein
MTPIQDSSTACFVTSSNQRETYPTKYRWKFMLFATRRGHRKMALDCVCSFMLLTLFTACTAAGLRMGRWHCSWTIFSGTHSTLSLIVMTIQLARTVLKCCLLGWPDEILFKSIQANSFAVWEHTDFGVLGLRNFPFVRSSVRPSQRLEVPEGCQEK